MHVSLAEAEGQLPDLVSRAVGGEEVVLTRGGKAAVRLVPVAVRPSAADRKALVATLRAEIAALNLPPIDAARSQDFLYNENGLPA